MKIVRLSFAFLITILTFAVFNLTGRRKDGVARAKTITLLMQKVSYDIQNVSEQLTATNSSLNELISADQSEFKKSFYDFESDVTKITGMENNFRKHLEAMKIAGNEYFEEWQKEENKYNNTDIIGMSIHRRIGLKSIYVRITQNKIGVKDAFRTYVSDMHEIKMFISNDLTSKGIDAISHLSGKVIREGENFRISIINLHEGIENLIKEMLQT